VPFWQCKCEEILSDVNDKIGRIGNSDLTDET